MERVAVLHPSSIIAELKRNNFTHVVWLPDSETNFMYHQLTADPDVTLVPVCREGETMAIAAGLWVGGKKPVALIQNTGIFESGDSIRGLGLDVNQPLVMLVGYRGWDKHGITTDSASPVHRAHPPRLGYQLLPGGNRRTRTPHIHGRGGGRAHVETGGRAHRHRVRRLASPTGLHTKRLEEHET